MKPRLFCGLLVLASSASSIVARPSVEVDLIPRPRKIIHSEGAFRLDKAGLQFDLAAPSRSQADRLSDRLRESLKRAGLKIDEQSVSIGKAQSFVLVVGRENKTMPQPTSQLPEQAQGYELVVAPSVVRVHAATEVGLFYGIETFEQLVNAAIARKQTSLPCCRIMDWPAIPMRGFMEDYGRDQVPTIEDHKRSIRTLAQFKLNVYLFYVEPDHFVYKFDPDIGKNYDRFTADEMRELVAYAKRYHVEIIPNWELLGHMRALLSDPKYQHLAEVEGGADLCPTCPEARELVTKIVGEIAPLFESRYFHPALDESWTVGRGKSAKAVALHGLEQITADYYNWLNELIKSHGKTMMMYHDIILSHPKILDLLARDIELTYWRYYNPSTDHEAFNKLHQAGWNVTSMSSIGTWNCFYPLYPASFANIEGLSIQTARLNSPGHFLSAWGTTSSNFVGSNLSEVCVPGIAYCGAMTWNPKPIGVEPFSAPLALQFFGTDSQELAEALTLLARCQGDEVRRTHRVVKLFLNDPANNVYALTDPVPQMLAFWKRLKAFSSQAHEILKDLDPPRNADYLKTFDLCARLLDFTADKALLCREIAKKLQDTAPDRSWCAEALRDMVQRQKALWTDYRDAYLATNRPINLKYIQVGWEQSQERMAKFAERILAGEFPEAYEPGLLVSFDFDEPGSETWSDKKSSGINLSPDAGDARAVARPGGPSGKGHYLHLPRGAYCKGKDPNRVLAFTTTPFWLQTWVRHDGQTAQEFGSTLFSYGKGGGFSYGRGGNWRLSLGSDNELVITFYRRSEVKTQSVVPPDGQWHHVAFNFFRNRRISIYVDGKLTETKVMTDYPRKFDEGWLVVGNDITGMETPFAGDIDRIRIGAGILLTEDLDSDAASPK